MFLARAGAREGRKKKFATPSPLAACATVRRKSKRRFINFENRQVPNDADESEEWEQREREQREREREREREKSGSSMREKVRCSLREGEIFFTNRELEQHLGTSEILAVLGATEIFGKFRTGNSVNFRLEGKVENTAD